MKPFRVVAVVMLVLAVLSGIGLGWNLRPGKYDGWIATTGTVVRHDPSGSSDDRTWSIVVSFTDETGAQRQVESNTSTNRPKPIGESVEVHYPPGEPDRAALGMDSWFGVLFFGIWTLVTTILAVAFAVASRLEPPGSPGGRTRGRSAIQDPPEAEDTSEPTFPPAADEDPTPDRWPRLP